MKFLVNDKELAKFLISRIDLIDRCRDIELDERSTAEAIQFVVEKKTHHKYDLEKFRDKFKEKIWRGVSKDLEDYRRRVLQVIENIRSNDYKLVHKHIEYFLEKLGEQTVIDRYMASSAEYFIKTVGVQLDDSGEMVRRKYFQDVNEDCLMRNTVGNENLLLEKIDKRLPFWFIDSGYTNFIEPNKKWHRLVRNHLHFNTEFSAPADRLKNFPSFPRPWKKDGRTILIIEPGPFAAGIFHVEAPTWSQQIAKELKRYTDRPIEIREKINKKQRTSLYDQLVQGDYYCTISINSNSAVESVWAGIPAITLDKHVSNPVTRNRLDQINDLYYGPLGDWLAWMSYCQFTYDELMDGTAIKLIRQYHGV